MLGTVVAEIAHPVPALWAPPTDVNAVLCGEETGVLDIVFVGPSRGAVEVFCVLRQLARAATGEHEEDADAQEAPSEDDHLALEERPANPLILRRAIPPSPRNPRQPLGDAA